MRNTIVPSIVNLELTNACNLECVFCDHTTLKNKMTICDIDESLLNKILSDISGNKLYELGLVGLGEPLLDRNFQRHLEVISNHMRDVERISINTNGVALTSKNSEVICKSAINHVTFSLNAKDPKTYTKLTKRDCFQKVVQNIRTFMEIKKLFGRDDLSVNVQAMASKKSDMSVLNHLFENEIKEGLYVFERALYHKPIIKQKGLSQIFAFHKTNNKRYPCWSIFSRVYIDVLGNVYPCTIGNDCYRQNSDLYCGNIKDSHVLRIYNNTKLRQARENTCKGVLPFEECHSCNVWLLLPNNFEWDDQKLVWDNVKKSTRLKHLNG